MLQGLRNETGKRKENYTGIVWRTKQRYTFLSSSLPVLEKEAFDVMV